MRFPSDIDFVIGSFRPYHDIHLQICEEVRKHAFCKTIKLFYDQIAGAHIKEIYMILRHSPYFFGGASTKTILLETRTTCGKYRLVCKYHAGFQFQDQISFKEFFEDIYQEINIPTLREIEFYIRAENKNYLDQEVQFSPDFQIVYRGTSHMIFKYDTDMDYKLSFSVHNR